MHSLITGELSNNKLTMTDLADYPYVRGIRGRLITNLCLSAHVNLLMGVWQSRDSLRPCAPNRPAGNLQFDNFQLVINREN